MALIGTPAAIKDIQDAHVDAMEVEPFDSKVSDTARIVYGNSSSEGSTGMSARSAKHHDRSLYVPDLLDGFVSPTE